MTTDKAVPKQIEIFFMVVIFMLLVISFAAIGYVAGMLLEWFWGAVVCEAVVCQ